MVLGNLKFCPSNVVSDAVLKEERMKELHSFIKQWILQSCPEPCLLFSVRPTVMSAKTEFGCSGFSETLMTVKMSMERM